MASSYPRVMLPDTEVRSLFSSIVNQEFRLFVALPRGYYTSVESYPLLVALDANGSFGIITEAVRYLQLYEEAPPIVVVGVGYPVNGYAETRGLRVRDLTPVEDEAWHAGLVQMAQGDYQTGGTGGARHFLRFLREELQPFLTDNYRVDSRDQALLGYSFGGLFALYTLFHAPEAFHRYIIGSPSIWWSPEEVFGYEERYAKNYSNLPARVFLSAGELEESLPQPFRGGPCAFVSNMRAMADRLQSRRYKSLDLKQHVFEGETHISGIPAAISRGLREVYRVEGLGTQTDG